MNTTKDYLTNITNITKEYLTNITRITKQLFNHLSGKVSNGAKMLFVKYTLSFALSCAFAFLFELKVIVIILTFYKPTPIAGFLCCLNISASIAVAVNQAYVLKLICYLAYKKLLHIEFTEEEWKLPITKSIPNRIDKKYTVRLFHWLYIVIPILFYVLVEHAGNTICDLVSSIIVVYGLLWFVILAIILIGSIIGLCRAKK